MSEKMKNREDFSEPNRW